MNHCRALTILFMLTVVCSQPTRAGYIEADDLAYGAWNGAYGTFEVVHDNMMGAGANGARTAYDPDVQIFSITSNSTYLRYLGSFEQTDVWLSLAAFVERNTGTFRGGAWSMLAGAEGLPLLNLSPGSLLMQGSVLDLTTEYEPCLECPPGYFTPQAFFTHAFLEVTELSPNLGLQLEYLHFGTGTILPTTREPWAEDYSDRGGALGWWFSPVVRVPEPATFALFGLGLLMMGFVGLQHISCACSLFGHQKVEANAIRGR